MNSKWETNGRRVVIEVSRELNELMQWSVLSSSPLNPTFLRCSLIAANRK